MSEETQDEVADRERGFADATEVSWAVRALQRAQGELDRALAGAMGLRALDYAAVTQLLQAPRPLGPVELAHRLGISTGSGTELADRLERSGHLRRQRSPGDRRRIVLELEHGSVAALVDHLRPLLAGLEQVADTFTDDERATITRYLADVTDRTRAHAASLAPPPG